MELSYNKFVKKILDYGNLVMFSHTIFSVSFAIVAILMATNGEIYFEKYIYAFIALISARTGANAINRVIDAKFDSLNPRTQNRDIPKGVVSLKEATIFSTVCFIIMVLASFMLNPLCAILSPIALFMLVTYSYTKRFTFLCHLYLGLTCSIAPMGAYLAITGEFNSIIPFVMSLASMFWVGGFDIIYGSQDYEFDKANNLNSMATKFGVNGALKIALLCHIISLCALYSLAYFYDGFGIIYVIGIVIITILFFIEHNVVKPHNFSKVSFASYSINQIVAIVFMFFSVVDIYF